MNEKYRVGFFIEEYLDDKFIDVFSCRKACKNINKLKEIIKDYNQQINIFIKENENGKNKEK